MIRFATSLLAVLFVAVATHAPGQEFRVFTRIHEIGPDPEPGNAGPLGRSLTLFHTGLAYDYVVPAGELIVFDRGNRRFTLLSTDRRISAVVDFDQVNRLNKLARQETEKYLADLRASGAERSRIDGVRFQLDPRFEERYDAESRQLVLSSPFLAYRVDCADDAPPEAVDAYLRYADWMARLNHVLHPGALPPASRIALNESLRTRKLLPLSVELEVKGQRPVALRAEHQVHWNIDSTDRRSITKWKSLLRDEGTRQVDFRTYQRSVLQAANEP